MNKHAVELVREHLNFASYEVTPPKGALKLYQACTIRGPMGSWEQGTVGGYIVIRDEVYALALYDERPTEGMAKFDFIQLSRIKPWRPVRERQFKLSAPILEVGKSRPQKQARI